MPSGPQVRIGYIFPYDFTVPITLARIPRFVYRATPKRQFPSPLGHLLREETSEPNPTPPPSRRRSLVARLSSPAAVSPSVPRTARNLTRDLRTSFSPPIYSVLHDGFFSFFFFSFFFFYGVIFKWSRDRGVPSTRSGR